MANLQAQIPKQIENGFDDLFRPWRALVRRHESNIDVAMRSHLPASITTNSHHSDAFRRRGICHRICNLRCIIKGKADDLVDQKCLIARAAAPLRRLFNQAPSNFCAALAQGILQQFQKSGATLSFGGRSNCMGNGFAQQVAVDNVALTHFDTGRSVHGLPSSRWQPVAKGSIFKLFRFRVIFPAQCHAVDLLRSKPRQRFVYTPEMDRYFERREFRLQKCFQFVG